MSDSEPEAGQEPLEKMMAAFGRAMTELAEGFRAAAEALEKIARDPRVPGDLLQCLGRGPEALGELRQGAAERRHHLG